MDDSNTSSNSNNLTNQTEAAAAETDPRNMMLLAMMPSQNQEPSGGGALASSNRPSFSSASGDDSLLRERPLPNDFMPGPYTVIIGKSRSAKSHRGTLWLQELAKASVSQYRASLKRSSKSAVITKILEEVKSKGCFAKRKGNTWWEVSDDAAREKIGYAIRENLPEQYNSTSKAKGTNRLKRRLENQGLLDPVPLAEGGVGMERASLPTLPNDHPLLTMDPMGVMDDQRVSIPGGRPLALHELAQDEEMFKHIKSLQSMPTDTLPPRRNSATEMLQIEPEPLLGFHQDQRPSPLHQAQDYPPRESPPAPKEHDSDFSSSQNM